MKCEHTYVVYKRRTPEQVITAVGAELEKNNVYLAISIIHQYYSELDSQEQVNNAIEFFRGDKGCQACLHKAMNDTA